MTDEEINQAARDVAGIAPWQWQHEILVATLVKLKAVRLETARAAAEECEGLAGKAQLEADSQISWYESQRPEACAAAAKLCASAIRARFGVEP